MKMILTVLILALFSANALAEPPRSEECDRIAQLEEADKPAMGLGLAESLLSQNKLGEAEKLALRALKDEPDNQRALMILGKIAISRGNLEEASEIVDKLLKLDDTVPDHHALAGMVAMFKEQPKLSVEHLEKALILGEKTVSPEQCASYANTLVLAHHKAGQPEEGLRVCLFALKKYPQEADLYLSASRLYRETGDFQSALRVAQDGLRVRPDFPNFYASIALAEAALGHKELSEQAYQHLLERDPELAKALRATLDGIRADDAEYKVRVD